MAKEHWPVKHKTVFITGAARGIGAELARQLHSRGARVALVGLEPERLRALAEEFGHNAMWMEADVTDLPALEAAASAVQAEFGNIDIVVANAGILHMGSISAGDLAGVEQTLQVNLFGLLRTLRATLPQVTEQRGHVVNIASLAALAHGPAIGAYAASKAAVDALSDSLRIELASQGVGVSCAYFGAIDTDLVQGTRLHPAMAPLEKIAPGFMGAAIPVSRAATAIVNGIEARAARIWAPKWVQAVYTMRGVVQPLMDAQFSSSEAIVEAVELADEVGTRDEDLALGTAANALEK